LPFTNLHVHPDLLEGIRELGFTRPTPIQADAVPPALDGRDLLARAQTGSGKTIAFLLPVLHRLMDEPRRTTRALIAMINNAARRAAGARGARGIMKILS
jgi:ATP-dependent RNA helicase RhlE